MNRFFSFCSIAVLSFVLLFSVPAQAFEPGFDPYSGPEFQKDPNLYYVVIDISNQMVLVYRRGADGQYSDVVKYMPCTSGMSGHSTPRGTFKMPGLRERFGYFVEFKVYAQYHTQIVRGVYVHSFLFNKRDENAAQVGTYNRLGSSGSHGCVRLRVEDARWIYYNCPKGTTVTVKSAPKDSSLRAKANKVPWAKYNPGTDPNPVPAPIYGRALIDTALRAGPAAGNSTVAKLKAGDTIELLQFGDMWIKVRIPSNAARPKEGFMQRDFAAFLPDTQVPEYIRVNKIRTIAAPIYEEPTNKSKLLGRVEYMTNVRVIGEANKYKLVSVGGVTGYVLGGQIGTYSVAKQ